MADIRDRRSYAGNVESTTSFRAPTPAPRRRTSTIKGVPKGKRWSASDRANKPVSKSNAKLLKVAHNAVGSILDSADAQDLAEIIAELELADGTAARKEKRPHA